MLLNIYLIIICKLHLWVLSLFFSAICSWIIVLSDEDEATKSQDQAVWENNSYKLKKHTFFMFMILLHFIIHTEDPLYSVTREKKILEKQRNEETKTMCTQFNKRKHLRERKKSREWNSTREPNIISKFCFPADVPWRRLLYLLYPSITQQTPTNP